jgi:Spy/CpxP family protein refolding chaperone
MKRSRQVFLITAVLVLCAGVVVGRLTARLSVEPSPPQAGHPPSWLADQLDLSAEQRQQMDAIWAAAITQMHNSGREQHDLDRQRDDAIRALLSSDQEMMYDEINDTYRSERQQLEKERDALIKSAEERSRALLTDAQKAKWDTLPKPMHGRHPPGPGFGPTSQWSGDHEPPDHGPPDHEGTDHGPSDHETPGHGPDTESHP